MKLKNLWLIAVAILIYACNAEETRSWEVTFDPNKPKDPNAHEPYSVKGRGRDFGRWRSHKKEKAGGKERKTKVFQNSPILTGE